MSDEIIDALIEQLMSKVNEEEPALLMTTEPDSYGTFRTMHRKAQKLMNEWLEEPEEETREELEVDSKQAWGALREWLLTALSNGDWNPEWLAWTTYTLLYGSDPWETHEKILEIIAKWMKLHPEPEAYNEDGYKACIKKLDQVLGDSTGEPMLLLPLSMISVINDLSLTDIEHKTDEATKNSIRDTLSPSAIEELQQLRTLIKKIRLLLKEISTNAAARDINLTTTRIDNCYGSLTSLISSFAGPEEEPEPEPEPEPEREAAEPEPVPEPDQTATPTPPEKNIYSCTPNDSSCTTSAYRNCLPSPPGSSCI